MKEKLEKPHRGAYTEVQGNRQVVVDGCDGVVDFTDTQVVLRAGRLKITINGKALQLKIFTNNAAVTNGYICSVEYGYV